MSGYCSDLVVVMVQVCSRCMHPEISCPYSLYSGAIMKTFAAFLETVNSLRVSLSIGIVQIYYCHSQSIAANRKGELALKVETDLATITTHFKDLEQPSWSKWFFLLTVFSNSCRFIWLRQLQKYGFLCISGRNDKLRLCISFEIS